MRDVAMVAGVSAQTVSRVLGGRPNVQEATRAKVLAAVKQLGYHRTNTARALVTGQSMTVGVLTLASGYYSRAALVLGIERAARQSEYTVNATTTDSLAIPAVSESLRQLIQQGVDGIIIAVPLLDTDDSLEALTKVVPTLTLDGARTSSADVVAVNQTMAVRLAMKHLLDLGHRTVWHVSGPPEWSDAASRVAGWRAALQEAGREVPPELHGDWSPESGYRCGLILAAMPEVTAVLVASDEMAFGVMRALAELGRRVPEDISIVGIDDIALAAYATPPLTTVSQSFEATGRRAFEHLLRQMRDPDTVQLSEAVAPTLIVRATTAPPRIEP
ncbi:LacI family DNA-binding transcriptional regulator [Arthrobacter sp. GAS37]|uniref:LacI family DNA-binding transcriptional regulator n=1 Tax=Arthrobacter sp. GAS37 TaxID=3156261 RepID=UPI0038500E4A